MIPPSPCSKMSPLLFQQSPSKIEILSGFLFSKFDWRLNPSGVHTMKTEHINWAWFLIPHAAQGKIFPTCNFFLEESTKSYIKITFFYQKVRDFPFLCHLIWPRWFNFLVHECLNLIRFCFSVPYALCIYTVEKKPMTKNWKIN